MVRHRPSLVLAALLAAGGGSGCLLDTGTINKRPSVQISTNVEHAREGLDPLCLYRGAQVKFTATITDPNDKPEALTVVWRVGDTYEEANRKEALSCESDSKSECLYTLPDQTKDSLWVVVQVVDPHSASASASREFSIKNRAPVVTIERSKPSTTLVSYPLTTNFSFSAKADDADPADKDQLTYVWTVTLDPDDRGGQKISCSENSDSRPSCSFMAKSPGKYRVTLSTEDPSHAVGVAERVEFTVAEDSPPCIVIRDPVPLQPIHFAGESITFSVSGVTDDVDPYPYGSSKNGTFIWSSRRGTSGPFQRYSLAPTTNQLKFSETADFRSGEQVQFRVEYQDSQGSRVSCDSNVTCCSSSSECCSSNQFICDCAQWITWTVLFR